MAQLSTHLHFAKLVIENIQDDIEVPPFLLGITAPDTYTNNKTYLKYHYIKDRDNGDDDIDVHEFYEKFNLSKLSNSHKWFVIGYYAHLWFDEYIKFNSNRLTLRNNEGLSDSELSQCIKDLFKHYDRQITEDYYGTNIKKTIESFDLNLNLKTLKFIKINRCKEVLLNELSKGPKNVIREDLIYKDEYLELIDNSVEKFLKSLN
ncbi:MAG TPA: hypothetical protein DHM42_00030 [Clostridiales bacterium]|jgi:hypothetical protein|nr:hypothetical protein [Clostridiales bacterium]